MGCRFSLQGIFLTQWLNPHPLHLLHWQADSLSQHHLGSPGIGKSGDIPPRGLGRGNSSESTDSRHYLLFSPVRSQESNSTLLLLFSLLVMSDSLPPHGLQHARIPCPPSPPRFCSNMSIESVMTFNHLILCRSLLYLLSIFPASGSFPESALLIRWPRYWSFSFSISPSNEYSGLLSFRVDWFDLFVVQRNLKSLLQHQTLKASILQHSAFFELKLV